MLLAPYEGPKGIDFSCLSRRASAQVQTSEEVAIKLESIKSKHPQLLYAPQMKTDTTPLSQLPTNCQAHPANQRKCWDLPKTQLRQLLSAWPFPIERVVQWFEPTCSWLKIELSQTCKTCFFRTFQTHSCLAERDWLAELRSPNCIRSWQEWLRPAAMVTDFA